MQHLTTEQLTDYMHGALLPEEDARTYAHLESCAQCRSAYDAEAALTEFVRAQAAAEERELPPTLKAAIWEQIRAAQPSPASRLLAWLRPAISVPIAAAIALALYFGPGLLHERSSVPAIDAAFYLQDHAALNSTIPFSDHMGANPAALYDQQAIATNETAVKVSPPTYTADAGQ